MEGKGTLTMPAGHTRADVDTARQLAQMLELSEMHVFWTEPSRTPAAQPFPLAGIGRALSAFGAMTALGGAFGWLQGHVEPRAQR